MGLTDQENIDSCDVSAIKVPRNCSKHGTKHWRIPTVILRTSSTVANVFIDCLGVP